MKDPASRDYLGARNAKFGIFPGSALFKKQPRWVMAAELVETTRLWGRIVARIDPEWIEPIAAHLVRRTYSEPRWEKKRAAVMASERVTLLGLPIVVDRPVNYGRIDPPVARELFIRHALVQGEWHTNHRFLRRNAELLAEAEELEHKARRRDIVVDEETLFEFYDQRVGAGGRVRAALRHLVEEDPPRPAGAADLRPGDAGEPGRGRREPGRVPGCHVAQRHPARAAVPVRAGHGHRRGDRAGAARAARPGQRGRAAVAGAGHARRADHRADPLAAQAVAAQLRAGAGLRGGRARPAGRRRRADAGPGGGASCGRCPGWSCRRTRGSSTRCPSTCARRSRWSTRRQAGAGGQGPRCAQAGAGRAGARVAGVRVGGPDPGGPDRVDVRPAASSRCRCAGPGSR